SLFGQEVYCHLREEGHKVVGVFTVPDKDGKADPLARLGSGGSWGDRLGEEVREPPRGAGRGAESQWVRQWGAVSHPLSRRPEGRRGWSASVQVPPLAGKGTGFAQPPPATAPSSTTRVCSPGTGGPRPSTGSTPLLPRTLIHGDKKGGFTIFWADDGLDTGDLLLQKECEIFPDDTVSTLYSRFLFPEGIKGMVQAVKLIAEGRAPRLPQPEDGATYEGIQKKETAQINWEQPAEAIHNWIRGNDKVPGAWTEACGQLLVKNIQLEDGKMIPASQFFRGADSTGLELTEEDLVMAEAVRGAWKRILPNVLEVEDSTDFFKSGAASVDVVRLVEEVKELCDGLELENEDIYMATTFGDFIKLLVRKMRGDNTESKCVIDHVSPGTPTQARPGCHRPRAFVDAEGAKTYETINPTDGSDAFEHGLWGKISARDRGRLLYSEDGGDDGEEDGDEDRGDDGEEDDGEDGDDGEEDDGEDGDDGEEDDSEEDGDEMMMVKMLTVKMVVTMERKMVMKIVVTMVKKMTVKMVMMVKKMTVKMVMMVKKMMVKMVMMVMKMMVKMLEVMKMMVKMLEVMKMMVKMVMMVMKMMVKMLEVMKTMVKMKTAVTMTKQQVCGIVIPWNYPLMMLSWKTAACLAAGNTVVIKPAQVTPLTALKLAELTLKAGIPKGVINVLPGSGKGRGRGHEVHLVKTACYVGMSSVFFNKGENCIAAGRLFVEDSVHDQFVQRVKLVEYCQRGVKEGATLVCGFFFEPTVFTGVEDHMFIAQEESFGPVMIISRFADGDVDAVLSRANATEFGLASGVFTRDISKALYVSDKLEAGTVFVNTYNKTDVAAPFGGFKQSGFGKDLGEAALNEYLRVKTVTFEY
ncbi:hypothetical protein E2I00_014168, partial [Balaenoptera physalus]